jgi:2'-5' RNA ligase
MFQRVNVAVKPPKEVQEYAFELSQKIAQETDVYFVLDGKNFYPHATIYSTEYPEKNVDIVLEKVAEIIKNTAPFIVTLENLSTHKGYIDFQLLKTDEWMKLHDLVVSTLNPLRENHLRKKYTESEELAKYTGKQREYIKQYGYVEVYSAFRPHITLSRIKDDKAAEEVIKKLDFTPFKYPLDSITAYSMGDHGTCNGIIKEFKL